MYLHINFALSKR